MRANTFALIQRVKCSNLVGSEFKIKDVGIIDDGILEYDVSSTEDTPLGTYRIFATGEDGASVEAELEVLAAWVIPTPAATPTPE